MSFWLHYKDLINQFHLMINIITFSVVEGVKKRHLLGYDTISDLLPSCSFFTIVLIVLTALDRVRRKAWEIFQYSHYIGFAAWWVAGVIHQYVRVSSRHRTTLTAVTSPQMLTFTAIPLLLYIIDIVMSFIKGNVRRKCVFTVMSNVVKYESSSRR